jgi:hypothetical protein
MWLCSTTFQLSVKLLGRRIPFAAIVDILTIVGRFFLAGSTAFQALWPCNSLKSGGGSLEKESPQSSIDRVSLLLGLDTRPLAMQFASHLCMQVRIGS